MKSIELYQSRLDAEMRRRVSKPMTGPNLLYGMMHYHLGWADRHFRPTRVDSGKRIRPNLLLLATESQGGDWTAALPAAAAIELLHNFTLIHDDIEDRDEVRRGRPTLWALWGIPQAINAGDALFSLSYQSILALKESGIPAERVLSSAQRYTEVITLITEGQCRDLAFESQSDVDEVAYLVMVSGKTAALLGLATELGSTIAGTGGTHGLAMREFGEAMGMAFQMLDDLLGLWGDPQRTGKPVGSDLLKGKKTLPILYGLQHSAALREMLLEPGFSADRVPEALEELEAVGSRAHTEAQAEVYHQQAQHALAASGGSGEAYESLRTLAETLLRRQK